MAYQGKLTPEQRQRVLDIKKRLYEIMIEKDEAYNEEDADALIILDIESEQLQAEIDEIALAGLKQANISPTL